ncbi:hypothetical protein RSOLAG1IB_08303 [Rhizoctonia solani AG-1 IB]|uniref:Uncharacterized protein n=1 Tax=Thanatephorus cucumeris (strain AG1-IB / isolate 7/3/14) TaxID=1108050 RepID=A0A0B7FHE6_THACB|nr:hypothetical protein RSOLAG1IB_08303 [Rhizoctonia solani AG-1 IB]
MASSHGSHHHDSPGDPSVFQDTTQPLNNTSTPDSAMVDNFMDTALPPERNSNGVMSPTPTSVVGSILRTTDDHVQADSSLAATQQRSVELGRDDPAIDRLDSDAHAVPVQSPEITHGELVYLPAAGPASTQPRVDVTQVSDSETLGILYKVTWKPDGNQQPDLSQQTSTEPHFLATTIGQTSSPIVSPQSLSHQSLAQANSSFLPSDYYSLNQPSANAYGGPGRSNTFEAATSGSVPSDGGVSTTFNTNTLGLVAGELGTQPTPAVLSGATLHTGAHHITTPSTHSGLTVESPSSAPTSFSTPSHPSNPTALPYYATNPPTQVATPTSLVAADRYWSWSDRPWPWPKLSSDIHARSKLDPTFRGPFGVRPPLYVDMYAVPHNHSNAPSVQTNTNSPPAALAMLPHPTNTLVAGGSSGSTHVTSNTSNPSIIPGGNYLEFLKDIGKLYYTFEAGNPSKDPSIKRREPSVKDPDSPVRKYCCWYICPSTDYACWTQNSTQDTEWLNVIAGRKLKGHFSRHEAECLRHLAMHRHAEWVGSQNDWRNLESLGTQTEWDDERIDEQIIKDIEEPDTQLWYQSEKRNRYKPMMIEWLKASRKPNKYKP